MTDLKRFDRRGTRAEYNLLSALDRNPTTINAGADICAQAKSTILAQADRIEELEAKLNFLMQTKAPAPSPEPEPEPEKGDKGDKGKDKGDDD